jgi:hypothetical protein
MSITDYLLLRKPDKGFTRTHILFYIKTSHWNVPYLSKPCYFVEHKSYICPHDGITGIAGGLKLKTERSCGFWWYDDHACYRGNGFSGRQEHSHPLLSEECRRKNAHFSVSARKPGATISDVPGNIESIQNCFTAMAYLCISIVPFTTNVQRSEIFSLCKRTRLNLQREIGIDRRHFQTQILLRDIYVFF